jgi:hypothetical protein
LVILRRPRGEPLNNDSNKQSHHEKYHSRRRAPPGQTRREGDAGRASGSTTRHLVEKKKKVCSRRARAGYAGLPRGAVVKGGKCLVVVACCVASKILSFRPRFSWLLCRWNVWSHSFVVGGLKLRPHSPHRTARALTHCQLANLKRREPRREKATYAAHSPQVLRECRRRKPRARQRLLLRPRRLLP